MYMYAWHNTCVLFIGSYPYIYTHIHLYVSSSISIHINTYMYMLYHAIHIFCRCTLGLFQHGGLVGKSMGSMLGVNVRPEPNERSSPSAATCMHSQLVVGKIHSMVWYHIV